MERCGCGKVEFRRPFCGCAPIHEPKPFSSMNRSSCAIHGPKAEQQRASFVRAAGDATCAECGEPYRDHTNDDHEGPRLTVLCDGTRVRL